MSSAARHPPFDDQFRRRFIELHKDNLFHVSCEHLTRGCTFNRDRSIRDRSARDLRLTWPCPLVAPDWINGCTVERKARIPLKVCKFSRARHRTERQPAVYELASDSRVSRVDPIDRSERRVQFPRSPSRGDGSGDTSLSPDLPPHCHPIGDSHVLRIEQYLRIEEEGLLDEIANLAL